MGKIRKNLLLLVKVLCLILLLGGIGTVVSEGIVSKAQETLVSGDFSYRLLPEGGCEITDYSGTAVSVSIPETIGGHTVKRVGGGAFEYNRKLKSVTFSQSIKEIGNHAFYQCESLTDVTLNNGLQSINLSAFYGCEMLQHINLPEGLQIIEGYVFSGCRSLEEIHIPDSVTKLGGKAFEDCTSLKRANYPASWTEISGYGSPFSGCDSLKTIEIPEGVTDIVRGAFYNCTGLESIVLPKSLKKIGDEAFGKCRSLEEIHIPDSVTTLGGGAFAECSGLREIEIPAVFEIGGYTFSGCSGLQNVKLSEGLRTIGYYAFENCSSLIELEIPAGVGSIGTSAFLGCNSLQDVFYGGSAKGWKKIAIKPDNLDLLNAKFHYGNKDVEEFELSDRSLKYLDDIDGKEKTELISWGGKLFSGNSKTIDIQSSDYFENLVKTSAVLSCNIYDVNPEGLLEEALIELGAYPSSIERHAGESYANPRHIFAYEKIWINDKIETLIFVNIRGSKAWVDWMTDFSSLTILSDQYPKEHDGFSVAKENVVNHLKDYMSKNGLSASNSKVLVSGHSYGAAVANLTAKELEKIFDQGDIYCNAFAVPNTIVIPDSLLQEDIDVTENSKNIHNFRNSWDPVVHVPFTLLANEWYTIYGQQHWFNIDWQSTPGQMVIAGNHNMTHYINHVTGKTEDYSIKTLVAKYIRIKCPVDVTVYNKEGELLGAIYNGKLDENVTKVLMVPVKDEKIIIVPADASISVKIKATDSGTMNVEIFDYDMVTGEVFASKDYSDVSLTDGKLFETEIAPDKNAEEVKLHVMNQKDEIIAEVQEDGSEIGNSEGTDVLKNPFSDVQETDYFFKPVIWAVSEKITSGIGNTGKFQPDGICSRAHVVTFLWKQAGCPKPSGKTESSFEDVTKEDYFYDAVLWAVENDITQGVGNTGRFEPYADCTRAHVVTFLWRAAKKPIVSGENENDFPDVSKKDYFYEAMLWAVSKGVTNGVGTTGKFMPDNSCTRANAVTFMYRAADKPLG